MSREDDAILAKAQDANTEYRWDRAPRSLVGLTVFACFLCVPAVMRANIFTDLIGAVSAIGSIEGKICNNQSSQQNYNTGVVAPPTQLSSLKNWLASAKNSYGSWFNSVLNVKIGSASLGSTSSFENALRSGLSGGNGSSISSAYTSVYGARLSGNSVNTGTATSADAYDSAAQEGMALAAKSDSASMQLISTASGLESMAASTAPGTADQIAAESQALQLHSNAMQHHVLASMLRQEATRLATMSTRTKAVSMNHASTVQNLFGGKSQ